MKKSGIRLLALSLFLGGYTAVPAAAQESLQSGLDKCAAIRNAAERLFCFDSLAAGKESTPPTASSGGAQAAATSASSGTAPAAAARQTRPPVSQRDNDDSGFGLELANQRSGPQSLTSRYDGTFTGWTGDTVFTLENGQVWKQVETDRLSFSAERPVITIRRGWFGAFYLKVEGANKQIRVKRIK